MTAIEKFNNLHGNASTKAEIIGLSIALQKEGYYNEATRTAYSATLINDSEKVLIHLEPKGLSGSNSNSLSKEALDGCGRLKKGYKFVKGGIIKKVQAKKKTTTNLTQKERALKNKILKLKTVISTATPKITEGLNGGYLADGHQILTPEELLTFSEDEHLTGLNASAKDVEVIINELILEKIKTGEKLPPWKQTWASKTTIKAQNFISKTPYSGSNSTILNVLLASIMPTPYYLTFNQIKDLKGELKKGSKGVPLVYYNFINTLKNYTNDPFKEAALLKKVSGFKIKRKGKFIAINKSNYYTLNITDLEIKKLNLDKSDYISRGFLKYYNVFNIADTTGIEYKVPDAKNSTTKERIAIAEAIIKSFKDKPEITEIGKEAFYNIKKDSITIPKLQEFDTSEDYYATLFHELVHSTMHESRLNRVKQYEGKDNEAQYAFEELIAELGASYLCGLSGILEATHISNASYLKGWHEKLQKHTKKYSNFFVFATKEAQKAVDYIIKNWDEKAEFKEDPKPEKYTTIENFKDQNTKSLPKKYVAHFNTIKQGITSGLYKKDKEVKSIIDGVINEINLDLYNNIEKTTKKPVEKKPVVKSIPKSTKKAVKKTSSQEKRTLFFNFISLQKGTPSQKIEKVKKYLKNLANGYVFLAEKESNTREKLVKSDTDLNKYITEYGHDITSKNLKKTVIALESSYDKIQDDLRTTVREVMRTLNFTYDEGFMFLEVAVTEGKKAFYDQVESFEYVDTKASSKEKIEAKKTSKNPLSLVIYYPIDQIKTDTTRFQNRSKLNQSTVDNIVDNFKETQLDPLIVWTDPKDKKIYLLAGHHRLEALKQMNRDNVPVKFADKDYPTEKEAIKYARTLSNANRTLEQPYERAKIYREMLKNGESKISIEKAAIIENKNKNYILNLASLSDTGAVIEALESLSNTPDKQNEKAIEKIADWIGEARRRYPNLTNAHETEMFKFLNDSNDSKRIKSKSDFIQKIFSIVGGFDFEKETPLNLKRIKYTSEGEKAYDREYKDLQDLISTKQDEITSLKSRFNDPTNEKFINPSDKDYNNIKNLADKKISGLNSEIKTIQKSLLELARNKANYTKKGQEQGALFGSWHAKNSKYRYSTDEKQKLIPGYKFTKGGQIVKVKKSKSKKAQTYVFHPTFGKMKVLAKDEKFITVTNKEHGEKRLLIQFAGIQDLKGNLLFKKPSKKAAEPKKEEIKKTPPKKVQDQGIEILKTSQKGAMLITDGVKTAWIMPRQRRQDGTYTPGAFDSLKTSKTTKEQFEKTGTSGSGTKYFLVKYKDRFEVGRAFKVYSFDGQVDFIPQSAVKENYTGTKSESMWVAAWALKNKNIQYGKKSKFFEKGLNGSINIEKELQYCSDLEKKDQNIQEDSPVDLKKANQTRVYSAKEVGNMSFDTLDFKGKWANLFQHPAKNMKIAIMGKPKNGKTSGSMDFASYLTEFGKVLYNVADQGINKSTQDLIKLTGLDSIANAYISTSSNPNHLEEDIREINPDFVFVDMINDHIANSGITYSEFKERFIKKYPNTSFALVFEATKSGDFKGNQGWTHIVDQLVNVEDYMMESKGRYGIGECIIWEDGAKRFNPKRYQEIKDQEGTSSQKDPEKKWLEVE